MITDRFIKFLKVEYLDWMGKLDEEKKKASDKSVFDTFFGFFSGKEKKQFTETEKKQAYEQYQKFRQTFSQNQQSKSKQNQQQNTTTVNKSPLEPKYYAALEVRNGAGFEEIKTGYKAMMKKYHPDRFANDPEKFKFAQQVSQKINEAFQYFEKKFGKK